VIFNSEVQGDIGNCFGLNSDEDGREVNSSETDRVDGVRISKRGRGDGDVLSLPVFKWVVYNETIGHGVMLEEDAVVRIIVAFEED
jgi:hypothetical protein